jgi:NAD(P)-dependent dehydrogenase (short-subunit alcohol dehydrogenase family)
MDQPRVALVTGASTGFGAATVTRFRARGVRVFGTSRAGSAELIALDVDREDSVRACVAEVVRRAGRLDYVVNNAGRAMIGACEETTADEARALFETNVFGVMRVVAAALPVLRAHGGGSIVNVGSLSGYIGVPFHGVYAASKHALAGYTEALRAEVRPFGVRVAVIEPAAHRTGIAMARPAELASHYDGPRERVEAVIRGQIDGGASADRVAAAIVRAAMARRTPWRVRVGGKARLGVFGRWLLPASVFEWYVRRELRLA